jgi:hypothetical protein
MAMEEERKMCEKLKVALRVSDEKCEELHKRVEVALKKEQDYLNEKKDYRKCLIFFLINFGSTYCI